MINSSALFVQNVIFEEIGWTVCDYRHPDHGPLIFDRLTQRQFWVNRFGAFAVCGTLPIRGFTAETQ
jgi:hypothetical protein